MNETKKNKVGDVCRERRDPARGTGAVVTSHSSPAAGGPDTVNTQRGIRGRWEAGSYRVEQKGSILSVTAVKTTRAVSHIDSGMYRV